MSAVTDTDEPPSSDSQAPAPRPAPEPRQPAGDGRAATRRSVRSGIGRWVLRARRRDRHLLRVPRRQGRRTRRGRCRRCGTRRSATPTGSARRSSGRRRCCWRRWPSSVPARAGLFNIGGEGQLLMGAIGAIRRGRTLLGRSAAPQPSPSCSWRSAARVAGAAWAAIPAVLRRLTRDQRGHHLAAAQLRRRPRPHLARASSRGRTRPVARPGLLRGARRRASGCPIIWGDRVHVGIVVALRGRRRRVVAAALAPVGLPAPGPRRQPRGRPSGRLRGRRPRRRGHARRRCPRRARRHDRGRRRRGPAAPGPDGRLRLHRLPRLVARPPRPAQGACAAVAPRRHRRRRQRA